MLLLLLYVMAVVRIVLALALSLVHRVTASTAVQVGIVVAQQSILHGRWQTLLLLLLLVMILLAPRVLLLLLEILSMVWLLLLLLGLGSSSSTARETIALEVVGIDLLRLLLLRVIGWRWTRGKGHKLVGVRRQTRGPDQCGIAQVQSCKRERIRAQSTQSQQPATKIVQQV